MPLPLVNSKLISRTLKHLVAVIFVHITKVKAEMLLNRQEPGFSDFEQIRYFLTYFLSVPHKIMLQYSPLPLHIPHCEL